MEKDDFVDYRPLAQEVRELQVRLRAMEGSIYSPTQQRYSHTPRSASGKGHTMEAVVASHDALEKLYREKLVRKNEQLLAVEQSIESLKSSAERLVMRYRYIDGRSWRKVCQLMRPLGYSERQVYRLHGSALKKLKDYRKPYTPPTAEIFMKG